jgi:prepilin-type N-terminal cleavage/methylation domain-containing protein
VIERCIASSIGAAAASGLFTPTPRETAASAFPEDGLTPVNENSSATRWRTAGPTSRRSGTRKRFRDHGLTLIELVVVLVVLVALGALLMPVFGNLGEQARADTTRATLARVAEAIDGPGGYAETMRYARDGADTQFVGYATGLPWPSPGEVTAGRTHHPQLHYLFVSPTDLLDYTPPTAQFYDPVSRIGWRGGWLSPTTATAYEINGVDGFTDAYGEGDGREGPDPDDLAPMDAWGRPVIIQWPDPDNNGPDPDGDGVIDNPDELLHVRLVSAGPDRQVNTPGNVLAPTGPEKGDDIVLYLYREDPNP